IVIALVALAAAAAPGRALDDLGGNTIPDTAIGDGAAQLAAPPSIVRKLTLSFDGTAADGTGDTGSPEDDLAGGIATVCACAPSSRREARHDHVDATRAHLALHRLPP